MTKVVGHGQRIIITAAAITILVGLSGRSLTAATVSVGTCATGGTHFTTIQAAVNAVAAGSTIQVCPGNYPEQVVIKENLTLTGVRSGNAENPVLVIPSDGFAKNTTSLTSGHPLAAQILVESPATNVTIQLSRRRWDRQQFEYGLLGPATDRNLLPERLGTAQLCRCPKPSAGRSELWMR